ncbi:MAG: hypothetical protein CMI34_03875 [Opitutales bacterium]|nr:hypothetical protein [Opitutales bacterium]|tara:strand:+ start:537 stop:1454 length:918 start_codon:yes stop_codon:yes gene_type:complete
MRKYLNNPRIVIPLALFVMLWVCHSYGLLDQLLPNFSNQPQSLAATQVVVEKEVVALTTSGRVMQGLVRDQWLLRSWSKSSAIKSEPFVANFSFAKNELPEGNSAPEVVEEVVVIDPVTLDQYIVEHLGLDEMGFFVRFGSINKRQGDLLHTTDGRELVLGSIALAEERRTDAEHAATVALHLSRMQLRAVIKNALSEVIFDPSVAEDVALLTETELAELSVSKASKLEGTFREGDIVTADSINRSDEDQTSASAVIYGGQFERQIYRLGEFVQKNPALGLAEVHEDYVQLVDRYGKFYRLNLND